MPQWRRIKGFEIGEGLHGVRWTRFVFISRAFEFLVHSEGRQGKPVQSWGEGLHKGAVT